jgi:hypothetical protein
MKTKTRVARKAKQIRMLIRQSQGRYFGVEFVKRTTGELRRMSARIGIDRTNGSGMKYDPVKKNLMVVWDVVKDGYRMINLETVRALSIDCVRYTIN